MRSTALLFVLLAACSENRRTCYVEILDVALPVTIERGGVTTSERLAATLTPTNVPAETFDSLAGTLVRGRMVAPSVVWSVPAFNTDPGGIAVAHPGRLARGATLRVHGVLDGGGWGVMPATTADSVLVAIEAGEFVARNASGTLTVLETAPLALRLDVTATDSTGGTMRVTGNARFSSRREQHRCDSFDEPD